MAKLLRMDPERQRVVDIAKEMFAEGASITQVRVRVNKECPGVDPKARKWTVLEIDRERRGISGTIHSPEEAADPAGAGRSA